MISISPLWFYSLWLMLSLYLLAVLIKEGLGFPKMGLAFSYIACVIFCKHSKFLQSFLSIFFSEKIYQKFECSQKMTQTMYEKARPIFKMPKPSFINFREV